MHSKLAVCVAFSACVICFAASPIDAQMRTRITPTDARPEDEFGTEVAIHGSVAIVRKARIPGRTEAYIFRLKGEYWLEEAKLVASNLGGGRNFYALDASDDVAVATVEGRLGSTGAAYVYRYIGESWNEEAILLGSDVVSNESFGNTVSIDSDRILVAAAFKDDGNGAAYVFSFNGDDWREEAKLVDPSPGILDRFGVSVDLDRDVAVVGSYTSDNGLIESGSAHVFRFDGSNWTYEAKLVAPDAEAYDHFGHELALDGNWILVGTRDNDRGDHTGSVHAFRWDGTQWAHAQKILAEDAHEHGYFGWDIAISNNRAVIAGSIEESVVYSFVFDGEKWAQETELTFCEDVACEFADAFGESVGLSGQYAIIGSSEEADEAGAAYIYELGAAPTGNQHEIPANTDTWDKLTQSFPNPVGHHATIRFSLSEPGPVKMSIVDLLGRERSILIDRELGAGEHTIQYDVARLGSGTYFYRLTTDHASEVRPFVVAR